MSDVMILTNGFAEWYFNWLNELAENIFSFQTLQYDTQHSWFSIITHQYIFCGLILMILFGMCVFAEKYKMLWFSDKWNDETRKRMATQTRCSRRAQKYNIYLWNLFVYMHVWVSMWRHSPHIACIFIFASSQRKTTEMKYDIFVQLIVCIYGEESFDTY